MKTGSKKIFFLFLGGMIIALTALYWKHKRDADNARKAEQTKTEARKEALSYQERVEKFMAMPNDSNEIIFAGDSHIDFFPLEELFRNPKIKNRGIAGEQIPGLINRLEEITEGRPAKIFYEIGVNDLIMETGLDTVMLHYKVLLELTRKQCPAAKIYVHSLLPAALSTGTGKYKLSLLIPQFNSMLKNYCDTNSVRYIDLYSSFMRNGGLKKEFDIGDELHLNKNGYLHWTSLIEKYIAE